MNQITTIRKSDILMMLLDAVSVYAAYFLALVLRVAMNDIGGVFRTGGEVSVYMSAFYRFAPWYTLLCIAVFILFRLYGAVWRYAGLNDMYRIFGAWAVTCLIQVFGTLLFVRRMPITYYVLGAFFQLVFVAGTRFAYRIYAMERKRREKRAGSALVVGAGELGRQTIQLIQNGDDFRVECIVDTENEHVGRLLDGIPVFHPDDLRNLLERYHVSCVFLAEPHLSLQDRKMIEKTCREMGTELRAPLSRPEPAPAGQKAPQVLQFTTIPCSDENTMSQEDAWLQSILNGGKQ